jgi:hypothetical protein
VRQLLVPATALNGLAGSTTPRLNRSSGERVPSTEGTCACAVSSRVRPGGLLGGLSAGERRRPASAELDRPGALISISTAPAKKRSLFATFLCGFCDNADRGRVLRLGDLASPIATPSQSLPPAFIYADARPDGELAARYSACPSGPLGGLLIAPGHPRARFRRAIERGDLVVAEATARARGSAGPRFEDALRRTGAGESQPPVSRAQESPVHRARRRTGQRFVRVYRPPSLKVVDAMMVNPVSMFWATKAKDCLPVTVNVALAVPSPQWLEGRDGEQDTWVERRHIDFLVETLPHAQLTVWLDSGTARHAIGPRS